MTLLFHMPRLSIISLENARLWYLGLHIYDTSYSASKNNLINVIYYISQNIAVSCVKSSMNANIVKERLHAFFLLYF